jgi:hypothetical protein
LLWNNLRLSPEQQSFPAVFQSWKLRLPKTWLYIVVMFTKDLPNS